MATGKVLLWCFGVMAALVGLCWVVSFFQRNLPSEKFDERQQQVRGRANGLALTFGYAYYLIVFIALRLERQQGWALPLSITSMVMLGLLMQAMILHIYAMLHNAELPFGEKRWVSVLVYGIMGFAQLNSFRNGMHTLQMMESAEAEVVELLGTTIESAREDLVIILIFSVTFFTLAAMHLIRMVWPEKEE